MTDTPDQALLEIAQVFRCHPTMAGAIADRIRQKLGRPVSNAEIVRVMKRIAPSRLSVDAVVAKLQKQPQRKPPAGKKPGEPADAAVHERASLEEQLALLLADNWRRAAAENLPTPTLDVDAFVKAVRQYTGHKDSPMRRILRAAAALDREDVVLHPHVVADRVNEMATAGDETDEG